MALKTESSTSERLLCSLHNFDNNYVDEPEPGLERLGQDHS